ncbi:Ribonucleases P/MRP protein subunit pop1 [Taxawa tesnikishii (nom. ined.)]|nr:Ribonucleases P/MRP protein subunit pop1 [Dothideales sp. JES 119]
MPPKSAPPAAPPSNKRKQPPTNFSGRPSDRSAFYNKRQRIQRDARTLATQTASRAFSNGELNVDKFVKAREYEIRALEDGLMRSKLALTQRAFQQVPRELRRRTASHNVKKVPKRLRKRAGREMIEDNTPGKGGVEKGKRKLTRHMRLRLETVKKLRALGAKKRKKGDNADDEISKTGGNGHGVGNAHNAQAAVADTGIKTRQPRVKKNMLKPPPPPQRKFKKRQRDKTWLPTHLFHAKRAHMTPPKDPLWRFSIPLTPTVKSYRPTHRASRDRGAVAWDTSYMSTIGLEGVEKSLEALLRALGAGYNTKVGSQERKWRNGTRIWQGWLYERCDSGPAVAIAPAIVVWEAQNHASRDTAPPSEPILQTHPRRDQKKHKRRILVRVHPSAFLQLWKQVVRLAKIQKPQVVAEDLRFELGSIEIMGPGSTEALLGALCPVPPPSPEDQQGLKNQQREGSGKCDVSVEATWTSLAGLTDPGTLPANALLAFSISDPRLRHPPRTITALSNDKSQQAAGVFDRKIRLASTRSMPSQKAINRRKSLAQPGAYPDPDPKDPCIPVLLYVSSHCPSNLSGQSGASARQASWTLILPWQTVPTVWYSVMYYPSRAVAFEAGVPWFPGDYVGTQACEDWESRENRQRKVQWERRPKGKRVEWESVPLGLGRKGEIGVGWACDWKRLVDGPAKEALSPLQNPETERPGDVELRKPWHLTTSLAAKLLRGKLTESGRDGMGDLVTALITVRLTLLGRGTPEPCARVYRLPPADPKPSNLSERKDLRARWLALTTSPASTSTKQHRANNNKSRSTREEPEHLIHQRLAADLLQPAGADEGSGYPEVPDEKDLVGFVTTGEFCLSEGKGVGIGSLLVSRVMPRDSEKEEDACGEKRKGMKQSVTSASSETQVRA